MIDRLIGQGSTTEQLKGAIGDSMRSLRGIAHRVAVAEARERGDADFAAALERAQGVEVPEQVNIESEMVALAEEQLRSETAMAALSQLYQQIRSGIREG